MKALIYLVHIIGGRREDKRSRGPNDSLHTRNTALTESSTRSNRREPTHICILHSKVKDFIPQKERNTFNKKPVPSIFIS